MALVQKTKSIQNLEERMERLDPGSFRYRVLDSAKSFKSSWIALGQALFFVYKDKIFREWEYLTFEAYCSKEVGIRQSTALKLLRSYSFLEHEAPIFLKKVSSAEQKPNQIPSVESVNALRLAKTSKRIPEKDYEKLREEVLDNAQEESQVKKKIRYILQANPPKPSDRDTSDPEKRRQTLIKKILTQLRAAKLELGEFSAEGGSLPVRQAGAYGGKMPPAVLKQMDSLISLLEDCQE